MKMKLNGNNSSQYTAVPIQGEDDANRIKEKKEPKDDGDFHMAPLTAPEESKEEIVEKVLPMTPLRKFCFVLSLLQCVLFVVAFGWLIPCKLPRYIDNPTLSVFNWSIRFPAYETVTVMEVSPFDLTEVVILGIASSSNETSSVQALNIRNGSVRWQLSLPGEPFFLDCDNLDVDADGTLDCIVGLTDHSAHMAVFNKSNMHIFWFVHSHQNVISVDSIGKPVVGVDCDDDRVQEVIFPFVDSDGLLYLGTASGLTGQIRGTVSLASVCKFMPRTITIWNGNESRNVVFVCADGQNENLIVVPSEDLCENTTNLDFGKLDSQMLERFNKSEDLHIETFVAKNTGENLLVVTDSGRVVVYDAASQKTWDENLRLNSTLRSVLFGHVGNSSAGEILIASGDSQHGSNIIILDASSGKEIYKLHLGSDVVTSILSFRMPHEENDRIILKVLEMESNFDFMSSAKNETNLYFLNEKFILMESFENFLNKTLVSSPLFTSCKDNVCRPDAYTSLKTASVVNIDGKGGRELVFFHRTYNESYLVDYTEVQLVQINDFIASRTCTTCSYFS